MGPWNTDLPFGKPEGDLPAPAEIDLTRLTDAELARLGAYRAWLLDGTPAGHLEHAAAKRRVEAVEAEKADRARLRATLGHDPSMCAHPERCNARR
jgi:hypothetical protein